MIKPMLASDWDEAKVKFPLLAQPKIDGVRGVHLDANLGLTGRSLKPHGNSYTHDFFSDEFYFGMDGELAGAHETDGDLCRITTSLTNTYAGEPYLLWHLFDWVTPLTIEEPYYKRYLALYNYILQGNTIYNATNTTAQRRIRLVPYVRCENMEQLLQADDNYLNAGYEGTIIRDPMGLYKSGRSTVREGGLLRIKRFIDAEAEVLELLEGNENQNQAQTNELGLTFRTTHQENMVPNGMIGAMVCKLLKDVVDPVSTKLLFAAGTVVTVSPGKMPHEDRVNFFQNPDLIVGKIIKFKMFPKGVKDKPRFPTFQTFRYESDM